MLCQVFLDAAIVDAEELIRTGSHVDVLRFSLRTFLVHEFIDGITLRSCLYKAVHDLKQCLTEWCRTSL